MNTDRFVQQVNVDRFTQQIEVLYRRLSKLYQESDDISSLHDLYEVPFGAPPLLPIIFRELGTASEELQVAVEELRQQNEELVVVQALVEAERQRYQDLFDFAPDGYLVTDLAGVIRFANHSATKLLNLSQQFLVDKPMTSFVTQAERQSFRSGLNWLRQQISCLDRAAVGKSLFKKRQEWEICLQPRHGKPFDAALTVMAIQEPAGEAVTLRWLVRDISERKRAEAMLEGDSHLSYDRPLHHFSKGDSIALNSRITWQVHRGLVRLSTFCERGEEVLVGLVGPSMLFGSSLTSLEMLQATALSDVELVCFPIAEIAASPQLAQSLLPQMNQRLRQTEALLAISGERRVEDRLYHLLRLLKQEIGQPVAQGTRLSIRLTHEDLANACCATRVTITRLLNKLRKQSKISFCPKRHIILVEGL